MCNAAIDFSNLEKLFCFSCIQYIIENPVFIVLGMIRQVLYFCKDVANNAYFQVFCIFPRFSFWLILRREHAGIGNSLADKNNRWITCFYCPWFYSKSSWNVLELSLNFFSRYPHQPCCDFSIIWQINFYSTIS